MRSQILTLVTALCLILVNFPIEKASASSVINDTVLETRLLCLHADSSKTTSSLNHENQKSLNNKKVYSGRNYPGKMLYGIGFGFTKYDSSYNLSNAYFSIKAPIWTIKEEGISRHVLLGWGAVNFHAKGWNKPTVLKEETYTPFEQIETNRYATELITTHQQDSYLNIGILGLAYNIGIPIKKTLYNEDMQPFKGTVLRNLTVGVGMNLTQKTNHYVTTSSYMEFSSPNHESVLLTIESAENPVETMKSQIMFDGISFHMGVPLFYKFGLEFNINHLFFGESEKSYHIGFTFTPDTYK
jgi:hypothetical protein